MTADRVLPMINARSFPLAMPAQPVCGTVET